jgi:predicted ester cyclase
MRYRKENRVSTEPETVVRRLIEEGFNDANLDVCDDLVAASLVEHQEYGPNHAAGAAGVKGVIASLHRAYSGFRLDIEHLAVDGELVWLHMRGSGTQDGPYMGHAPTGRAIGIDVFDLLRVEEGRIVGHWGVPDRLGALFQLGLAAG